MQKVCKICGRLFNAESGKQSICSNECRRTANRMAHNKYRAKIMNVTPAVEPTVTRIIEPVKAEKQSDVVIETLEKSIIDNLEMLDAVRDEISKLTNELKAKQSAYDQRDSEILHALEGASGDTKLLEIAKQAKEVRKNRRDYKNYILFLVNILKNVPQNTLQAFQDTKKVQSYRNTFYQTKY